ncbi:5-formyltetrahydrofolate cyclo-ligase [bacterium]|nr:5-formyltetrahydrofolate cyclo-ligase [bacterium]
MTDLNKSEFRQQAFRVRNNIKNRSRKSANIRARIAGHAKFQTAQSVLLYVSMRSEVVTRQIINDLLATNKKKVFIPYCDGDRLQIFPLLGWDQLERKSFGVLEPKAEFLRSTDVKNDPIELTIVPGVAFDHELNRVGYGKGYYDKLFSQTLPDSYRLAIAFTEQIFENVPNTALDIPMHEILTEDGSLIVEP